MSESELLRKIELLENQLKAIKSTHRPCFPKRIILVRHGESLGNQDEKTYTTLPDWKVPLTPHGHDQSKNAGKSIKTLIEDDPLSIYCSPYLRTKQTLLGIMSELGSNPVISAREEPRLTEQQFGNFQTSEDMERYKNERNKFGRFYYRFPQGESGLDVYDRVSLFIGTLFRDWEKYPEIEDGNVLIITHGLTMRLFLMRWFQYSVEEFEQTNNPPNASVIIMTRQLSTSKLSNSDFVETLYCSESIVEPCYILEEDCRISLGLSLSRSNRQLLQKKILTAVVQSVGTPNGSGNKSQAEFKLENILTVDEVDENDEISKYSLSESIQTPSQSRSISPSRRRLRNKSVMLNGRNSMYDLAQMLEQAQDVKDCEILKALELR